MLEERRECIDRKAQNLKCTTRHETPEGKRITQANLSSNSLIKTDEAEKDPYGPIAWHFTEGMRVQVFFWRCVASPRADLIDCR